MQRRPTASKNLGDDYRDFLGLQHLVRMLARPDEVLWVSFENNEAGSFDDVVIGQQDRVLYIQAKYTVEESIWILDDLFEKETSRSRSLLQKWARGWLKVRSLGAAYETIVKTRRRPSPEFAAVLDGARFSAQLWAQPTLASTKDAIVRHLAEVNLSETDAQTFLRDLRFEFGELDVEEVLEGAWREFLNLGGTEDNWNALRSELRRWVRYQQPSTDGRVRIGDVRRAAHLWTPTEWLLPQEFRGDPRVYVMNRGARVAVEQALSVREGCCVLLKGPPGSGKSSLLAWLANSPPPGTRHVFLHHCFVGMDDETAAARLDPTASALSLLATISNTAREVLRKPENPSPETLRDWLRDVAADAHGRGEYVLLVLDGLDHMVREHELSTARTFLNWLPAPVPPGLKVILGTQPVQDLLPGPLERAGIKAVDITGFDEDAVREYLTAYTGQELDKSVVHAALEKSEGNPLYLRYLAESCAYKGYHLSVETIERTPPYGGNIEAYYAELWRRPIPGPRSATDGTTEAQGLLALVGWANFPVPETDLTFLALKLNLSPAAVLGVLRSVQHLLDRDMLEHGKLRLYHESLRRFVRERVDARAWREPILSALLTWLRERADEDTRWSSTWELELYTGNSAPLLTGVTREWVLAAFAAHRSHRRVLDIINLATRTAASTADIRTLLRVGWLRGYVGEISGDSSLPVLTNDLRARLRLGLPLEVVFRALGSQNQYSREGVVEIARAALELGLWDLSSHIANKALARQADDTTYAAAGFGHVAPEKLYKHYRERVTAGDTIRYTFENAERIWYRAFRRYLDALVSTKRIADLENLATLAVGDAKDEAAILNASVRLHVQEGELGLARALSERTTNPTPYTRVVALALGATALPMPAESPLVVQPLKEKVSYFDDGGWREAHAEILWTAEMWATTGQDKRLAHEAERFQEQGTHGRFLKHLVDFGKHVHRSLTSGEKFDTSTLASSLAAVGTPTNRNGADYYAWKAGMDTWLDLLGDVLELLKAVNKPATLSTDDVKSLAQALGYPRLLPWLEFTGARHFEPEAARPALNHLEVEVASIIEPLLTRADLLSRLACVAAAVGDAERTLHLLARANANLLGHGYHKDMVLFQVLDALQASGYRHGDRDVLSLAPLINVITDVTDGDETSHLPIELIDHLLACRSPRFVSLYITFIEQGRVTWSETAAGNYLDTCSSHDPTAWALAMSLVEDGLEAAKNYLSRTVDEARRSNSSNVEALETAYRDWLEVDYPPKRRKEQPRRQNTEEHPVLEEAPKRWSAEELLENIANGRFDWEWSSRTTMTLQDWAVGHNTPPRADVLRISDALLAGDASWRNARIYDALQQILRRHGENERAFRALVAAQTAGSNWNSYFNEKRHSDARLEVVLSRYRNRLEEYIAASAISSVTSYGAITITPRIVDALARGGKEDLAAAITDDFVVFARGLSGDLTLPTPTWVVESQSPFDGLDLLLPRLGHLIPTTRVRAACALADLAAQDARVPERVTLWLERESLEARQLSALLALSLLARTDPVSVARVLTRVREKLGKAGLVTRLMFNEICSDCHLPGMMLPPTWPFMQQAESQQIPAWFELLMSHWPGMQGRVKTLIQSQPNFQARLFHMATAFGLDQHLSEEVNPPYS
jgi:energy-coupling factor transporter ATP-binding protein EcfA2